MSEKLTKCTCGCKAFFKATTTLKCHTIVESGEIVPCPDGDKKFAVEDFECCACQRTYKAEQFKHISKE